MDHGATRPIDGLLRNHGMGTADEEQLRKLGYKQEFKRSLSSFSNFGLAFTVLSIPASLLPFLSLGLETGGPRALLLTWPIVSIASIFVGLSMAEIVSAFPTSGGLYFWSAKLAPKHWAPAMSYYTGIFNFLGLWGLGSGTAYEVGSLAISLLYIPGILTVKETPQSDLFYRSLVVLVSFLALILCGYLNTLSSKALNLVGQLCLWINIFGLLANVLGTGYIGNIPRQSLPQLFGSWSNLTGFPDVYALLISILPAAMTYTGYDSAAHMAEETIGAAMSAPLAIMSSILLAFPLGFVTLWSLLAPIPSALYEVFANSPMSTQTVVDIFVYTQGPTLGFIQTVILTITTLTCPYAIIATHARMTYAFARDGGLPASSYLYFLNDKKLPTRALLIIIILDAILIVPSLLSASLFTAINSIGTVGTYISYSIPILLRVIKGKDFTPGPFSLGRASIPIGVISVFWMICASLSLMLPTQYMTYDPDKYKSIADFLWHYIDSFNWSPVMVIGVYIGATLSWFLSARMWFVGPRPDASVLEGCHVDDEWVNVDGDLTDQIDETKPLLGDSSAV